METVEGLAPPAASGPWGGRAQDSVGGEGAWSGERGVFGCFSSLAAALHCLRFRGNEGFGLARSRPKENWSAPLALS